jgi:hypothetical protein
MTNLSVTGFCNRSCACCFAADAFRDVSHGVPFMPLDLFDRSLDYVKASGMREARLLGGEPTLHPEFPSLVDRIEKRGLDLMLFSNGLMPETALRRLEAGAPEKTCVLVNANRTQMTMEEIHRQNSVLARLGAKALLGVNIDSRSVRIASLLDSIDRYNLKRFVRLGLAHPVVGGSNAYIQPKFYRDIGTQIAQFAYEARRYEIQPIFDCGFVPCMFEFDAADLQIPGEIPFGRRCSPIPDILPDGSIIHCYPLSGLGLMPLACNTLRQEVEDHFKALLSAYDQIGIFPHCRICAAFIKGECSGGCRAAAIYRQRFQFSPKSSIETKTFFIQRTSPKMNAQQHEERPIWVIPWVNQPLDFWQEIDARWGRNIKEVYLPMPGSTIGTGRPPQPDAFVWDFLRSGLFSCSLLVNPIAVPGPIDKISGLIIEQLRRLIGEIGVFSVTLANLSLAARIKAALPEISLNASVLMDIEQPLQALMIEGIIDTLVVSNRIMRNLKAITALKDAFPGKIRIIVNESCLPGCPFRIQHFYEMADERFKMPHTLCQELLDCKPWLRLTGGWILPQHLHLLHGLYDELKIAGRVTLRNPEDYFRVLNAYIHRLPLFPCEIGGGPASVLDKMEITEEFYRHTLNCDRQCRQCIICRSYWEKFMGSDHDKRLRD